MFCPKCATPNLEGASFCRSCGVNISLVPSAMGGNVPQVSDEEREPRRRRNRKYEKEPRLEHAFKNVFMGFAFLIISIALSFSRMGMAWWYWMLIPAFSMMGTGLAQYIRLREFEKRNLAPGNYVQPSIQPPPRPMAFPPRNTGELVATPPSVTEGTTRHLGAEVPTKHFDATSEASK